MENKGVIAVLSLLFLFSFVYSFTFPKFTANVIDDAGFDLPPEELPPEDFPQEDTLFEELPPEDFPPQESPSEADLDSGTVSDTTSDDSASEDSTQTGSEVKQGKSYNQIESLFLYLIIGISVLCLIVIGFFVYKYIKKINEKR